MSTAGRHEKRRATWRRVGNGVAATSLVSLAASTLLWWYYAATRPTEPAPDRLWALNYRGRLVYLLQGELAVLLALVAVFIVGILALIVISVAVDPFGMKERPDQTR